MGAIFVTLYNFFEKHRLVYFLVLFLLIGTLSYLASGIQLEEDISKALPTDEKTEKLNDVFQNSKFLDKLAILVSVVDTTAPPEPDSLVAFAEKLNEALNVRLAPY